MGRRYALQGWYQRYVQSAVQEVRRYFAQTALVATAEIGGR